MKKAGRITRASLLVLAVPLLILLACPNPLTQSMLNQVNPPPCSTPTWTPCSPYGDPREAVL